eukprot:2316467-Pyramimonas_sp.AAC.1
MLQMVCRAAVVSRTVIIFRAGLTGSCALPCWSVVLLRSAVLQWVGSSNIPIWGTCIWRNACTLVTSTDAMPMHSYSGDDVPSEITIVTRLEGALG